LSTFISAEELRARIVAGPELALVDLREEGEFANRHLLFAISIALSRLELTFAALIPRRTVPIVLCEKGVSTDLVDKGAERLAGFGYTDISILDGGIDAWERAGFELFSGVNVPSKAFGEFVEHSSGTPHVSASEVHRMIAEGENMVVLDSRPMTEYRAMSIPSGVNVPGAELAYRLADLAPDPETTVVVNCAGRTRSIIGAQSLINAGVPNKVVALENGTMGWHLAGFELAQGESQTYPQLSETGRAIAMERAAHIAHRYGVKFVPIQTVRDWQADTTRTTYLLDVRAPDEFTAEHVPGSVSAPGGQLVQATDTFVGVRGARLVLIDNDGVRATMTASWLIQLGWADVAVLEGGLSAVGALEQGSYQATTLSSEDTDTTMISPGDLSEMINSGDCCVIDLATSLRYRDAGHIPGAWFAIRARLPENLKKLPETRCLVLTSPDGQLAHIAASDEAFGNFEVRVLEGGTQAWRDAGLPIETGFTNMADGTDDIWYRPYDMDDGDEGAMKQYLSWEVNLVAQLERDGTTTFRSFPKS